MHKTISLFLLLFGPISLSLAQKIDVNALDNHIKELVAGPGIAGASVIVAKGNDILLNKGYGYAHLGLKVPATEKTKYFVIGAFDILNAALVFNLQEQNKLQLDDYVTKYLDGLPASFDKIKIRHLMNCTSGVPDYHYLGDRFENRMYTPDELIGLIKDLDFVIEPGQTADWSSSNMLLITQVIAKITGKTYQDFFKESFISLTSPERIECLKANS